MLKEMDAKLRKQDARYTIYDLEYAPSCVLSVSYLNPGQSTVGHEHGYAEGYYFARGRGRIELGRAEDVQPMAPTMWSVKGIFAGDFVAVPADTFHRVFNDSVCDVMVFVCAFCVK